VVRGAVEHRETSGADEPLTGHFYGEDAARLVREEEPSEVLR